MLSTTQRDKTASLMLQISEFKEQLFYAAGLDSSRVVEFSCGKYLLTLSFIEVCLGGEGGGEGDGDGDGIKKESVILLWCPIVTHYSRCCSIPFLLLWRLSGRKGQLDSQTL